MYLPRLWILTLMALGSCLLASGGTTGETAPAGSRPAAETRPIQAPSEAEIRQAIRDLNHPSPAKRRQAVRLLADWGPLAFDALAKVAAGPDLEPALLARDLLEQMGEVLFVGGRVRLQADRARIRWDEAVNLTLAVENPTPGAVVVPWPAESPAASSQPDSDDARQVGAFMDVADFMTVVGPDGDAIEPRVDPIEQDSGVQRAVTLRAGDRPPSHPVPAGSGERLVVHDFNRGWARFPLLAAGKYTVRFAYQPQWKDPTWTAQGFGLIESNPVVIEVTTPAPEEIREAERPVRLELRRENARVVGELQNIWDRELYLNLNIGGTLETHARLQWVARTSGEEEPEPFSLDGDNTAPQFAPDRIRKIAPGEKVVVSKADIDVIRQRAKAALGESKSSTEVTLKYTHLPSAADLRRALREKGRHESIPGQLFSGSAESEPISLEKTP